MGFVELEETYGKFFSILDVILFSNLKYEEEFWDK